jgi:hypothetical protein
MMGARVLRTHGSEGAISSIGQWERPRHARVSMMVSFDNNKPHAFLGGDPHSAGTVGPQQSGYAQSGWPSWDIRP